MDNVADALEKLKTYGAYFAENPADRLHTEEELKELTDTVKAQRDYCLNKWIGQKFSNGFAISDEIAKSIVSTYDKSKLSVSGVDSYTITTVGKVTMLIARDANSICLYTVEIPVDVAYMTESLNFDETIEEYKHDADLYKRIRWYGYGIVLLILVITAAIVYIALHI